MTRRVVFVSTTTKQKDKQMTLEQITTAMAVGSAFWTATECKCKEHKGHAWVRVAKADAAKLAYELQVNPFTAAGAKALNCAIFNTTK